MLPGCTFYCSPDGCLCLPDLFGGSPSFGGILGKKSMWRLRALSRVGVLGTRPAWSVGAGVEGGWEGALVAARSAFSPLPLPKQPRQQSLPLKGGGCGARWGRHLGDGVLPWPLVGASLLAGWATAA